MLEERLRWHEHVTGSADNSVAKPALQNRAGGNRRPSEEAVIVRNKGGFGNQTLILKMPSTEISNGQQPNTRTPHHCRRRRFLFLYI